MVDAGLLLLAGQLCPIAGGLASLHPYPSGAILPLLSCPSCVYLTMSAATAAVEEPRFALGEMVLHGTKGYRGVVCGWDLACCESEEWQAAAGIRWACTAGASLLPFCCRR